MSFASSLPMPLVDSNFPTHANDLALYAASVATCVIALNLTLVKVARRAGWLRPRSRQRPTFPQRYPR